MLLLLFCACGSESTPTFTVTFDTGGGVDVASQTVESGQKATKPTDPTKGGYTFKGWFTEATDGTAFDFSKAIISDTTVYAQWTQMFAVIFDTQGGSAVSLQTIESGGIAAKPDTDPTKEGYEFMGWYADAEFDSAFDFDTAITADTMIYAKWAQVFAVIFDTHDVDFGIPAQEITSGGKATKPADPTSEYLPHFEGWYKDEALTQVFDFETPINASTTLYAKWQLEGTRFVMMWVRSKVDGYVPMFEIFVAEDRLLGMGPSSYAFAESLGYPRGSLSADIFIIHELETDKNVGGYRWSGAKVPDDGVLDGWVPGPCRKTRGDDNTIIPSIILGYIPVGSTLLLTIVHWTSKPLLTKKLVAGKITLNAGFDASITSSTLFRDWFAPDGDANSEVRYIPVRGEITTAN